MKNPSQLSQRDQWIGLNLAVNFLCETYGINPEVVYATWERNGNLTNTAAHFRDQRGNDTATEPLQMCDFRHDESDDVASQPAAGPSKHERSSCRAISSADELPSLPAIAPKKRVRSRKRAPHMEIVPTSEPGEGDDSSSGSISQPMVPAPRKQIQPTAVREAPKSSPKSGHSPRVLDAHPSDADDSNSEESDSSSEGSKSDTEPSAPQRRSGASMPSRSDPPARSMESESSFDMSLSDQKQISDVENRTDSASEASVQQSLLCPTPHDQPTTTASRLNYESMNQSASDEGDSDVEDAAMLPEDPPLQAKVASQSESEQFELFSQRNCSESSGNSNVPDKSSNGDYESSYIPTQVSLFGRM
ncbi:hypothetical protein MSAN_02267600 [Mycena sanguinolenta]|uniref:Uncharacterized protein n=1 Tax=Mycena sanguinolenta TaxID=230812 RepID=A0A8H6XAE8_9AGAR|nr:hypothetical protein MSAN_02267600 [Mycena sanguinolenta]